MIWLVIISAHALFGIVFSAWAVANDKEPNDFKDDPYLWLFLNIPFWPFIGLWYLIMGLFTRLVDGFKRPEEEEDETDICVSMLTEIEEAPTVEPEPEWIPCSERLPEPNEMVLISVNGEVDADWIAVDNTGYGCWYRTMKHAIDIDAWMPLPEPYEGGQDGNK